MLYLDARLACFVQMTCIYVLVLHLYYRQQSRICTIEHIKLMDDHIASCTALSSEFIISQDSRSMSLLSCWVGFKVVFINVKK